MAQPNSSNERRARPATSTLARNFSQQLDGMFNLGEMGALNDNVQAKRQSIYFQSRELEELQARIKAAEDALRQRAAAAGTDGPEKTGRRSADSGTAERGTGGEEQKA